MLNYLILPLLFIHKSPKFSSGVSSLGNMIICLSLMFVCLFCVCVQVYVLGPKHDPSTVLSCLSEDKEIDEEEIKNFKHIHTCEVSE